MLTTLGFLATGASPSRAGRPIGAERVHPEPNHASVVGRNHLHVAQVHQIPV